MNGEFKIRQARFEEVDGTTRVDRPENTVGLHRLDMLKAAGIEHGIIPVRDKRPIEIRAEQPNVCSHERRHCRNELAGRQTAVSVLLPGSVRDLRLGR